MRELLIYTVYERPRDFPTKFVVRAFEVTSKGPIPDADPLAVEDTLDDARAKLPPGYLDQ